MTHRGGMVMLALFALPGARAGAQDTTRAPGPWKAVVLTNFGAYVVGHREREAASYGDNGLPTSWRTRTAVSARVLADWGVLAPVSQRSGVGASVVVSLDNDFSFVGLYGRYRYRLDRDRAVDIALGVPITRGHGAWPLGLLKYGMSRHAGIALRPEIRREAEYRYDGLPGAYEIRNRLRLSVGAEVGGLPGAITSVSVAAAIFAVLIAIFSSGSWS